MFRKDAQALAEWSPKTVEFCAARSRRILADIWPTLVPGGILIYSTCTFNHLENDDTVAWIAAELGADILPLESFPPVVNTRCGQVLLPGLVPGEGQYVAALRKHGDTAEWAKDAFRGASAHFSATGNALSHTGSGESAFFAAKKMADASKNATSTLPVVNVDRETALKYLHGDAIVLPEDAPIGPVTIGYQGHPLGPAKNLGKRCNNLYPKNKRIRMDIR